MAEALGSCSSGFSYQCFSVSFTVDKGRFTSASFTRFTTKTLRARRNKHAIVLAARIDDEEHGVQAPLQASRRVLLGASVLLPLCMHVQGAGAAESLFSKRKLWRLGEGEEPPAQGSGEAGSDTTATAESPSPAEEPVKQEPESKTRVYDASVLGEPVAISKDRERVWQKLMASRVVYLGEAERVPDPDDKVLELEIIKSLRQRCFQQKRPVTLALEAFPCVLQAALNQYMNKSLENSELKALVPHWPQRRWEEYEPILEYCRANGIRLMACGAPPEVLRVVQVKGIQGLGTGDRRRYAPPVQNGSALSYEIFQQSALPDVLANASVPFGPGPYRFAQARIVEDHTMAQVVQQALADAGVVGLVIVITGASHVQYGAKGSGLAARLARILPKKTQTVVFLNPERQHIRREGEVPLADFLWYSSAKVCVRNCFDRAEVARVMSAAGRRRDALPQDIQAGLDRGIISPELLQSFFDLNQNPILESLTNRFQGLRERLLADPRFLQRLAIEEAISITTTLIAQYERRKDRFWKELDYVITDSVRGSLVDFFTVWLPAPRLSFRLFDEDTSGAGLQGFLGSIPDNAFQRAHLGMNWDPFTRFLAVVLGGAKLFGVGFVSSIGTVTATNLLLGLRKRLNPEVVVVNKRSPILKTAAVYATFLGTSANLRYQVVAGVVEHWISDYFLASSPVAGNILSFVARTANSYWGTQQWVDLARFSGLQAHKTESSSEAPEQTPGEPPELISVKKSD